MLQEGFNKVDILNPEYSPGYLNESSWDPYRQVFALALINLSAPMDKMDVVLQDAKTGNDLGLIGTANLKNLSDSYDYGTIAYRDVYYKFTGDPKQPVSSEPSNAPEGHYKIKYIATGLSGKVITVTRDFWIYLDPPNFTSSLDGNSPFIEYKPGQKTYPFDVQITDPLVNEMKKNGVNVDQSSNFMNFYWGGSGFPYTFHMDKDGKFAEEIAMDESVPALPVSIDGYNMAGNKQLTKQYWFVKEGTPVTYLTSDRTSAKTGETVKAQLVLDNLKDVSKAEWTLKDNYGKSLQLTDAKLSDTLAGKATINVQDNNVTVQFNEPSGELDHKAVVDVTFKVLDQFNTFGNITPNVKVTDANNQNISVIPANFTIKVYPQFNRVTGYVTPKGFYIGDPNNGGTMAKKDWSKVGATVKLIDSNGKEFDASSSIDNRGMYTIENLPLSRDPYTVEMKVPGHFVTKKKVTLGFVHNDTLFGKSQSITSLDITAGDVNQDGVIDILDAIEIQKAWKTNNRAADINFDGVVDEKDMKFVQQNYLKQNPSIENAPQPKTSYDGKTLEMILAELGITP
jgi:hypothetical protein